MGIAHDGGPMKGLRRDKFAVSHHARGEVDPGECFVLVPRRDPAAIEALRAYARSTSDVLLSAELLEWIGRIEGFAMTLTVRDDALAQQIALWTSILSDQVRSGTMNIETALQRIAGHAAAAAQETR